MNVQEIIDYASDMADADDALEQACDLYGSIHRRYGAMSAIARLIGRSESYVSQCVHRVTRTSPETRERLAYAIAHIIDPVEFPFDREVMA